jgi:hypothetical protein
LYLRCYGYRRVNRLGSFQKCNRGHVRGGEGNVRCQTVTITRGACTEKLVLISVKNLKI